MDVQRIQRVYNWLIGYTQQYNWMNIPVTSIGIRNTKNGLIRISQDVAKEEPYLSNEIFNLKDDLFIGIGTLNQVVVGRLGEALQILMQRSVPQIAAVTIGVLFIRKLFKYPKGFLKTVIMQMRQRMLS